jgi:hypothetical protein
VNQCENLGGREKKKKLKHIWKYTFEKDKEWMHLKERKPNPHSSKWVGGEGLCFIGVWMMRLGLGMWIILQLDWRGVEWSEINCTKDQMKMKKKKSEKRKKLNIYNNAKK